MRTRVLAALSALAGLVALTLAPAAAAAPPLPFGHACAPREGALYCVEVPGRDAPTYRPSNGSFSVEVSRLRVTVPTRERRPREMAPPTRGGPPPRGPP